jgi:hypothetical protein
MLNGGMAKQLETKHKVIFIDAFNQDYIEDPFILIAAELAQALDKGQENTKELREKATGVVKAILPVGTKALINIIGRLTLGSSDISEDIKDAVEAANETAADVTSKWIEDKFKNHEEEKASLQHFKKALETIAKAQDKPIVIFIDELDRCRPTFAVKLIERIKHFFDVPNVVFVLLINREQLEIAIKGVYGIDTDSATYLGKFVNFFFRLPTQHQRPDITRQYIAEVLNRYNFEASVTHDNFGDCLSQLAGYFNLSLRDIERGIALYAIAQPISEILYDFLAYEITLKIAKPDLFQSLLKGDVQAHQEAKTYLAPFNNNNDDSLNIFMEWHSAYISNFEEIGGNFRRALRDSFRSNANAKNLFRIIANKIDLPLEL